MNNKGFAITTILYGMLILFLLLLVSMLGILATYKDRLSLLMDSYNGARDIINDHSLNVWTYDYTGTPHEFVVPISGNYKLEVWGAQGGTADPKVLEKKDDPRPGGYGGYSTGVIYLEKNDKLYIYVGGKGLDGVEGEKTVSGGYNGGGAGDPNTSYLVASGGGATHIATKQGLLEKLSSTSDRDKILIVAGGGGGSAYNPSGGKTNQIGCGGGYKGRTSTGKTVGGVDTESYGGTQSGYGSEGTEYGSFGKGANGVGSAQPGGGGGWWGGNTMAYAAGGGSGYIGNSRLKDKAMYCFKCSTSSNEETLTISVEVKESVATPSVAKLGNGYAKIELID